MNPENIIQTIQQCGPCLSLLFVSGVGLWRLLKTSNKPVERDIRDYPYTKRNLKKDFSDAAGVIKGDLSSDISNLVHRRSFLGETTTKEQLLQTIFNRISTNSKHEVNLRKRS